MADRLTDVELAGIERRNKTYSANGDYYVRDEDIPRLLAEVRALREACDATKKAHDNLVFDNKILRKELTEARDYISAARYMQREDD